jgi:hypothetical protein
LVRIVEAFVGEYASGKSENAVNRAVELVSQGRKVTLVDLDTVEPFYTIRPIKRELQERGIDVVAWETKETMGLGEAGSLLQPSMRWVLRREGDIIMDIGYGVHGARTLNLVEGADEEPNLRVLAVINIFRPMTATVADIVDYVRALGKIHGLINNSHLGTETTAENVQEGAGVGSEAAAMLGIPVVATTVDENLAETIGKRDCQGNPVRSLHRFMPQTFW